MKKIELLMVLRRPNGVMRFARWLSGLGVLALAWSGWAAPTTTRVDLVLPVGTARHGETILAGVRLRMEPMWHTYWVNPGEAGKSTTIQWTLPPGVTAGEILWPVPEKYEWTGLINYVYHGEAVLLVPLTLGTELPSGALEIKAKVTWLECKEQCVPGDAEVKATLQIGAESVPSAHRDLIESAKELLPKPFPAEAAKAWWDGPPVDSKRNFIVSWPKQTAGTKFDFYPLGSDSIVIAPASEPAGGNAQTVQLKKEMEKFEGDWPPRIGGVAIESSEDGKQLGAFAVDVPFGGGAEAVARVVIEPMVLLGMLGLAFLGGLILNIMPCVLPVIALKILGFVNQSHESPVQVRRLGWVYAMGVVASFLVLAGLVIGVQKAGKVASWGMQFGSPQFLLAIIVLVMLVSLNLFGVFEVSLGGQTLSAASQLASKQGISGAFFNGVLATALATPCTAPFLSVALGFAFAQPPGIIVLVFVVVALGMASPYVVLSWKPEWLRFLPKPGPWMGRFKVAMGFPMLATGVWLFSILERHYGADGVLWVGLFLVMVALAAWVWGEFVQRGHARKGLAIGVSLILAALGYAVPLENQLHWRSPMAAAPGGSIKSAADGIDWQLWSPGAVAQARAQGRPVFVDFTADWCLTCKANKKSSIEIPSVRAKLKEINAVALLADNTLILDSIGLELQKHGRAGVPLVLVYPKDSKQPPIVLPTLLTPGLVLDALDKAAK